MKQLDNSKEQKLNQRDFSMLISRLFGWCNNGVQLVELEGN